MGRRGSACFLDDGPELAVRDTVERVHRADGLDSTTRGHQFLHRRVRLGPFPSILLADWLADRLAGKPFISEKWYVAGSGEITKTPY